MNNFEIERKFIIKMPDISRLEKMSDRILTITQAYLGQTDDGFNARIRRTCEGENENFYFTAKKNVSGIKRIEKEYEISKDEYLRLFEKRLDDRNVIEKTRYCINFKEFVFEIDVFPFWKNQAFMEVELESEQTVVPKVDFVEILRDVTQDKKYTNFSLSKAIPDEII